MPATIAEEALWSLRMVVSKKSCRASARHSAGSVGTSTSLSSRNMRSRRWSRSRPVLGTSIYWKRDHGMHVRMSRETAARKNGRRGMRTREKRGSVSSWWKIAAAWLSASSIERRSSWRPNEFRRAAVTSTKRREAVTRGEAKVCQHRRSQHAKSRETHRGGGQVGPLLDVERQVHA